ncbi:MFS transporter [Streptomyces melanogenes]|uniref:MFS transporter n=1 Tax=Streptomyces melanogenes TaxID=67326 RepID=UPI00167F0B14|nr:MFS transporter [Streptomyces melanogenes]GGP56205.1 MFS transporter [Streptomyces melanogenes]
MSAATTAGPEKAPGLLRHRDFRLLWAGESVSQCGSAATRVLLPLIAVNALGAGAFTMGLLNAAAWLPWLLIGLPVGAWTDRMRRRPVMIVCNTVSAALMFSLAAAAWLDALTTNQLLVVSLLLGTADVFFRAAYSAYLPTLLPAEQLADGNARLQTSESAADVIAPGVGGALAQAGSAAVGFLADGLSFLVSAVLLARIRTPESRPGGGERVPGQKGLAREIRDGVAFLTRDPFLRTILLCDAAMNLFLAGAQSLAIVFLSRTVGADGTVIGVLIALAGLGGVLGAVLSPRLARRVGTARAVLLCAFGAGPFGLLIPLTSNGAGLLAFLVGEFFLMAGIVAGNVVIVSFRQAYCPPEMLGRVSSGIRFVMYGTVPIGSLLGGTLGAAAGNREALWILYAGNALCALLLLRGPLRGMRDLPVPVPVVDAPGQAMG